jgi:hypothetical protein
VLTFPLPAPAVDRLVGAVGASVELVDVRESDGSEDVVVAPSVSRQLIGKLRRAFPHATVLLVELEDGDTGVDFGGPVTRALDAGADGYVVARSIVELAHLLEQSTAGERSLARPEPLALGMPDADELSEVLDVLIREREAAQEPGTGS